MKLMAPDYYPAFRCIAGACRHTCCAGWEIDVDAASLEEYRTLTGELGARMARSLCEDEDGAHFRLTQDERCPFLNGDGLCDLIIGLGEEHLCQICADHPRFRSELSDRTEIGLGLCCEAAAALILGREEKTALITLMDDGQPEELWPEDAEVLEFRDRLIALAQDRTMSVTARVDAIMKAADIATPKRTPAEWADVNLALERLDTAWDDCLARLRIAAPAPVGSEWDTPFEQLLVCLLFRHVTGAAEDGDLAGRTAFAVLSWQIIRELFAREDIPSIAALAELARL